MDNIKVSIIIPVYNPGKLLIHCLDSVKNQTLKNIEVLCIDDGSTDGSLYILNEYSKSDNRFKVFTQNNLGAGSARNRGINEAVGDFIVFIDSDDWIEKDMCEILYNQAKSLNVDLILFNTIRHLKDNKTRDLIHFDSFYENPEKFTFDYHYIKDKVMNGYFGVIWCKFYKSDFIKENNLYFPMHKMFNDVEYHIKSLLLAKSIAYCPKILYHYMMIGQPSLQASFVGTHDSICFYDVMVDVKEFLINNNFMDEFRIEFLNYSFFYFKSKLNQMNQKYKNVYYVKIKSFFESLFISLNDLQKINEDYVYYYLHMLNHDDYYGFESAYNNFIENSNFQDVDINLFDFQDETDLNDNNEYSIAEYKLIMDKIYISFLENCIFELNFKINNNKQNISNLNNELNNYKNLFFDLKNEFKLCNDEFNGLNHNFNNNSIKNFKLSDENEYLRKVSNNLYFENLVLNKELLELKSSILFKFKDKF